ncbi:hypothetical protein INR49_004761 [Caranx melampygus]|nr:hypothetical protein INR49_004761 [Caranx melampygus]
MADVEAAKALSGLLNGIAQRVYYNNGEVTEELLRSELFPELPQDDLLPQQTWTTPSSRPSSRPRPGSRVGGVSAEQAAALSRFWKSQRLRVRESLLAQSRWEPGLRGLSWRVDLQTAAGRGDAAHGGPVTLMELELGRTGQDSEFVCLEFDEARVNEMLKKMADVQESIDRIVHRT